MWDELVKVYSNVEPLFFVAATNYLAQFSLLGHMKGFLGCSECLIDTTTWPCLVGLLNLLLLLQKPKANQRAQKPQLLLPKATFDVVQN
jgi:hypothetical protein